MPQFDSTLFAANWPTFRGFFQNRWELMTEEDFEKAEGDVDKLVEIWSQRYGNDRDRVYTSMMEIQDKFK